MTIIEIVAKEIDQSHTDPAYIKLRHTCALHMGLVSKKMHLVFGDIMGFIQMPKVSLGTFYSLCCHSV